MPTYLYNNEKPFSCGLSENIDAMRARIDMGLASLIIIDGGVGQGKTTLAVHVAEDFQKEKLDFNRQYAMGAEDFQVKLDICQRDGLKVLIYDEAGDFNRRGALTKINRILNRIFETYRGFRILVIVVLPNFSVLDKQLFDNQIPRMLINCHGRTRNYGNYRGYSLVNMFWIKHHMSKNVVTPQAYGYVCPNFRGHFLDLPEERSKELELISMEGKKKIISDGVITSKGYKYIGEIAEMFNVSRSLISSKIQQLKIKPIMKKHTRKYYDEEALAMIAATMNGR